MSLTSKIIVTVIITAVVVGGGIYYWQTQKVEPINTETPKSDSALTIKQDQRGSSFVTLQENYFKGAGFSLQFPSSWGFVSVRRSDLTSTDFGPAELIQIASYTFTSEFRPVTHYLTITISYSKYKDSWLVTQGNRIYIAEDATYHYNYNPSTQYCVEEKKCKEDQIKEINAEIKNIIDSFKLL